MGDFATFETPHGTGRAYRAGDDGPPVVVVQEYWGVVDQILGVTDRLAGSGFRVALPDLYDGAATDDPDRARRLMEGIEPSVALDTIRSTVDWLRDDPDERAGMVGFCMGGGLALATAGSPVPPVDAAVVFYGFVPWPGVRLEWTPESPALLLHFASDDSFAPASSGREIAQQVRDAGGAAEFLLYEGAAHAFCDETRDNYDPTAAESAWAATVEFLHSELRQQTTTPKGG